MRTSSRTGCDGCTVVTPGDQRADAPLVELNRRRVGWNRAVPGLARSSTPEQRLRMQFQVVFSADAEDDLASSRIFEQGVIVDANKARLLVDAKVENKRRKKLIENRLAQWELRIGGFRVFCGI